MAQQQTRGGKRKAQKVALPRGIRQRTSGRFIIDLTVDGERKTTTTDTLAEAIEKRRAMLAGSKDAEPYPTQVGTGVEPPWTLQDAFNRTIATVWAGMSSEKASRINASSALAFFGPDTALTAITTDAIDRYTLHLMGGSVSDATINRKLSALSRMLRTAHERGQLSAVPKMPRRKEKQGRIRFFTPQEEVEILKWMLHLGKEDHWEATQVLIDTGFRTGELWQVTASHVDFNRGTYGTITLWRTKNGKPRTVPMTLRVMEIVKRRARQHPAGPLFPGGSKDWYRLTWDRVRQQMGMDDDPEFVPHALRHTCCSRLVQRGVPLTHVQTWMGHRTIQTTMRYAHLMPHDLFAAVAVLEGGENARWDNLTGANATASKNKKPLLQ